MTESTRPRVPITLAINDYDHVRDLCTGVVDVPGLAITVLNFEVEEIFFRFSRYREWDVSELSLAKYVSLRAAGDDSITAIPVFPSRLFRHSAIYIRDDGPVDDPAALSGKRIGIPEWTQTATVYARDLLEQEYGVGLRDVAWVQAGTNEPGRIEGIAASVPDGVSLERRADATLNGMLATGELDAVIVAHPPAGFTDGSGKIRRLFSAPHAVERDYLRRTGVYPIMHLVAIRNALLQQHPWVAMNLMTGFEVAKRNSVARVLDANTSRFPVPWPTDGIDETALASGDIWPYGIEPNRTTLEAFLAMCERQRLCERRPVLEELFAPQVQEAFRI